MSTLQDVAISFVVIEIPARIESKINGLHGVTCDDVLDALDPWDDCG